MKRSFTGLAVAAVLLVAVACTSTSSSNTRTETFYGSSTSTQDPLRLPVTASGLFADSGYLILNRLDGNIYTLHLSGGSIALRHVPVGEGTTTVNPVTFSQPGTFRVLYGTGDYTGITGSGTYTETFTAVTGPLKRVPYAPLTTFKAIGQFTLP